MKNYLIALVGLMSFSVLAEEPANEQKKLRTCENVLAEWIINDPDKILERLPMSKDTAKKMGINITPPQLIPPEGCSMLVEAEFPGKFLPICGGVAITKSRCNAL